MKAFIYKLFFLLVYINQILGAHDHINRYFSQLNDKKSVCYLLSYPRSGNSLLRYLIEFVTKRPTLAFQRTNDKINLPLGLSLPELGTNMYLDPVWKVHTDQKIKDQKCYTPESTRLILILRNYKENLFREAQVWRLSLFDGHNNLNGNVVRNIFSWYCRNNKMSTYDMDYQLYGNNGRQLYFENIAFYDQLPKENKLLIYYEDLLQNPEKELFRICDFFHCSYEYIELLMKDYAKYSKRILAFYPENKTNGTEKIHYSHKYSSKQRLIIDRYVRDHYPKLWNKYLKRYAELS